VLEYYCHDLVRIDKEFACCCQQVHESVGSEVLEVNVTVDCLTTSILDILQQIVSELSVDLYFVSLCIIVRLDDDHNIPLRNLSENILVLL